MDKGGDEETTICAQKSRGYV